MKKSRYCRTPDVAKATGHRGAVATVARKRQLYGKADSDPPPQTNSGQIMSSVIPSPGHVLIQSFCNTVFVLGRML
ncbi:MAG: hypothetical protein HDR93_02125 [Bacteroides sp.]|nr:hypothetical protein [Bacteroides sp.]